MSWLQDGGGVILGDIDGEDPVASTICEHVNAVVSRPANGTCGWSWASKSVITTAIGPHRDWLRPA